MKYLLNDNDCFIYILGFLTIIEYKISDIPISTADSKPILFFTI